MASRHSCVRLAAAHLVAFAHAAIVCAAGAQPGTDAAATAAEVLRRAGVHCVHEDDIGFLWLCTGEGLARFDGRATVTFGPGAGELRALLRTQDGLVWTAGTAGVFEFVMAPGRGREPYLRSVPQPGGTSPVHALFQARDGSMWCATDSGVLRLADRRLVEIEIGLPADGPGRAVRALVVDESGALWAGAASGLYVRTPDGRTARFTTSDGLPSDDVRAVALDADGRLWVGTPAGLALVYRGAVERGDAWAVTIRPGGWRFPGRRSCGLSSSIPRGRSNAVRTVLTSMPRSLGLASPPTVD